MKNLRTKISEILKGTNRELKCPYCPYELMGGSIAPHTMKVHPDKFISRVDQLLSLFQKEVEDLRKFPSLTNDHNETLDEYDERKSYNQALNDLLEELKKG